MKSFINYIWSVMDSFGRARAASHFARMGNHEAARRIMAE
jgi:hypothetical protein